MLRNECLRTSISQCVVHFQPVDWPTTGPITKPKVEEHCRLKIEGSVVGELCGRLLNVTFDMEIEGCMEDVKVSLSTSYTSAHIRRYAQAHMHKFKHAHLNYTLRYSKLNQLIQT